MTWSNMRVVMAAALAALLGVPAAAQQPVPDALARAFAAMGGREALAALNAITIAGDAEHWRPDLRYTANAEPPLGAKSKFMVSKLFSTGRVRAQWSREVTFPLPSKIVFEEVATSTMGWTRIEEVSATPGHEGIKSAERVMSGHHAATRLRDLERVTLSSLVDPARAPERTFAVPDRSYGGQSLTAVAYRGASGEFTILFDRTSGLPHVIRTTETRIAAGDASYDLVLRDWRKVGNLTLPHDLTLSVEGDRIEQYRVAGVTLNPSLDAKQFEPSKATQDAAPKMPAHPEYDWIRNRAIGLRFIDKDTLYYDPATHPSGLSLVEVAPGVLRTDGGTHNSMVVERAADLVVFDAPINEAMSLWTIAAAKARFPGKPIRYLVMSHGHYDHEGGARTYMAEGATLIVGKPLKTHFERMASAPRTVNPDALQANPRPVTIIEVDSSLTLSDPKVDIRVHRIPNDHDEGMIISHIVQPNVVFIVDLWSPGRGRPSASGPNPDEVHADRAIRAHGLEQAIFVGGHGTVARYPELQAILRGGR